MLYAVIMQGNSRGYLYHDDFHSLAYRQGEYILCEVMMRSGTSLSSRQVLHSSVDTVDSCQWLHVKEKSFKSFTDISGLYVTCNRICNRNKKCLVGKKVLLLLQNFLKQWLHVKKVS